MKKTGSAVSCEWRTVLLLALILVIGAALRFSGLTRHPLSNDEMITWGVAAHPDQFFETVRSWDNNPPGHHLLMRLVIRICGDSEMCLRLPSAIFGVAALLVLFLLGRQLYSPREGLVAASLMAVFYPPVFFSQNIRPYSLLLLVTIGLAYFAVAVARAFRAPTRPPLALLAAFTCCAVVEAYLHYSGALFVLLVGAGFACFFLRDRRALAYVAGMYAVIALAYAPWIPGAWHQLHNRTIPGSPEAGAFMRYLLYLLGDSSILLSAGIVAGTHLAATALLPAVKHFRDTAKAILSSRGFLLFLWLIIPFLIFYAESQVSYPLFLFRYLVISFPAAYLLFARALVRLPLPPRVLPAIVAVVMLFAAYHLIAVRNYYASLLNPQWREAIHIIQSWAATDDGRDGAVIIKVYPLPSFADYYLTHWSCAGDIRFTVLGHRSDIIRALEKQTPGYVWWLDSYFPPPAGQEKDYLLHVDRYLRRFYEVTDFPLHYVNLRLYRRALPANNDQSRRKGPETDFTFRDHELPPS